MQCSHDEDWAVGKQRSSPLNDQAVMQRCSYEHKDLVMQRIGDEDEAEEMQ